MAVTWKVKLVTKADMVIVAENYKHGLILQGCIKCGREVK